MAAVPEPTAQPAEQEVLPARMLNEFVYCARLFYYEMVEGIFLHNADTRKGALVHERVDSGKGDLPAPEDREHAHEGSSAPDLSLITTDESGQETIHSRSVLIGSDRLGVTAKLDLVEVTLTAPDVGGSATEYTPKDSGCDLDLFGQPISSPPSKPRREPKPVAPPKPTVLKVCPVEYKVGVPKQGEAGPLIWDADRMQLGLQCLILRDNGYTCDEGIIFYRATRQRVSLPVTPELEQWVLDRIAAARRCLQGPMPSPLVDSPKCPRCSLVSVCLPDETRLLREGPVSPDDENDDESGSQLVFPFDLDFGPAKPPPPWTLGEAGPDEFPKARKPMRRLIAPRADTKPLYVTSPGLFLGKKSELVVVKDKHDTIQEIRMVDLDHVAIFGNCTLSTALVQTLCERDIPVTYFSTGGWFYGMTRGHSLKNVFTRIEQFEHAANPDASLALARRFVQGKIRNQRTFLMRNHISPPQDCVQRMKYAALHASEAGNLGELLGIEGAAAAAYYAAFSGMIKVNDPSEEEFDAGGDSELFVFRFTHRNRRPPRDAVNSMLSLAYSLLARDCAIAVHATGMDPYVGFYHQPRFGRPALALDLMEEFRPLIADSVVITAINNRLVGPADFVAAGQSVNLTAEGRRKFLYAYERRMQTTLVHPMFDYQVSYRRALELQARVLAKALSGDVAGYVPLVTR
jgi:CRISPR-associated protein Cas1